MFPFSSGNFFACRKEQKARPKTGEDRPKKRRKQAPNKRTDLGAHNNNKRRAPNFSCRSSSSSLRPPARLQAAAKQDLLFSGRTLIELLLPP